VLAVAALLLTGLRFAVLNEDRFVAGAGTALTSDPVSSAIGQQLTQQLIAVEPDLVTFEPLVDSGVTAVVRSGAARSAVEVAARQLYRTAVDGDADTAVLRLGNVGLLAVQSVRNISPEIAERIPTSIDRALVSLEGGDAADAIAVVTETAHTIRVLSWIVTGLALLVLAAAVVVRRDRTAASRQIALTLSAAGVLTIGLHFLIRSAVVDGLTRPETREAGFAVYDAFLDDTVTIATGAIGLGLLFVVALGALGRRVSLTTSVRLRWAAIRESDRGRRITGGVAVAFGALVLLDADTAERLLVPAIGLVLIVVGLEALLRSTSFADELALAQEQGERLALGETVVPAPDEQPRSERPGRRRLLVRGGIAAVVVVVGLAAIGGGVDESLRTVKSTTSQACNGSVDYCDLRLDEAVLPSTHNSYSSARDGFVLAEHQDGVAAQLQAGIRGFLIDSYLANETVDGRVYTRLDLSPNSRAKIEDSIGASATETAMRLRSQIGSDVDTSETPELFFCHGFCELGATRGSELFAAIREFLLSHPREVLVMSIEDQVPPEQFASFVEQAGLLDLTWKGPVDPLPTLGEMIDSGGRILWMVEQDAGDVPWYHQQFDLVQETPYDKSTLKSLLSDGGCAPNRGDDDNPLFLINLNVSTVPPRASFAETVNQRTTILEQVDRCERIRHRKANLIAVDFFRTGDVVGAAQELNDRRVAEQRAQEDADEGS
jgi:hypothetical protein